MSAANTTLSAIGIGAAGAIAISALSYFKYPLSGLHGPIAAAGLAALAYSPLARRPAGLRGLLLGAAVVVLLVGNFFGGLAHVAEAVAVGVAMGLAAARLLPYEAGLKVRLGAGLGSTVTFLGLALVLGSLLTVVTHDRFIVEGSLVLGIAALLGMQTTLSAMLKWSRAEARAAAATGAVAMQAPRGWFWGKLNHRALGRQVLGYRYIDPTAGASFHIVGELAALPAAEALRRAGYRGRETVRLGGHTTMYPRDGASAEEARFLQQEFDEGGPSGTVVLALSTDEKRALGLPDAPPWISTYLA